MDWSRIVWREDASAVIRRGPHRIKRGTMAPTLIFLVFTDSGFGYPFYICSTPTKATDEELRLLHDFIKARYGLD